MRTRLPMLVLSLVGLIATLGIAPQTCKANPVNFVFDEDAHSFNLRVSSGAVDTDLSVTLAFADNWTVILHIVETAGFGAVSDEVTITGTAIHNVGPHGEGPNALGVNFLFNAEAIAFAAGANQVHLLQIIPHGQHFNQFHATLTFTVEHNPGFGSTIANYLFTWDGLHTQTNEPIPEPATLILLGTGLAGIAARARKRRKIRKTEDG